MPRGCLAWLTAPGRRDSAASRGDASAGRAREPAAAAASVAAFPPALPRRPSKPLGPAAPPVDPAPATAAQTHAAEELLASPDPRPARVCAALAANAAAYPHDPRFRKIRLLNPRVHANVVCVPGALELLEASGFRVVFESASRRDPEAPAEGWLVLPEALTPADRARLVAAVECLRPALGSLSATSAISAISSGVRTRGETTSAGAEPAAAAVEGGEEATSPAGALASSLGRALSRLRSSTSGRESAPACGADAAADMACVGDGDEEGEGAGAAPPPPAAPPSRPATPASVLTNSASLRAAASAAAAVAGRDTTLTLDPHDALPSWLAAALPADVASSLASAAVARTARTRLSTPAQRAASLARAASRRPATPGPSAGADAVRVTAACPEGVSLGADFKRGDAAARVYEWVAACLAPPSAGGPSPDFELVAAGGRVLPRKGDLGSVVVAAAAPGAAAAGAPGPPTAALAVKWGGTRPATALLKAELLGLARPAMA